jgi:hypothetical protein
MITYLITFFFFEIVTGQKRKDPAGWDDERDLERRSSRVLGHKGRQKRSR